MPCLVRINTDENGTLISCGEVPIGRIQSYTLTENLSNSASLQLEIARPEIDLSIPSDQVTVDLQVGPKGQMLRFRLEDLQRNGYEILKFGDLVYLKSGGPQMLVTSVSGDVCGCLWSDDEKNPQYDAFPMASLTRVDPI